MICAIRSPSSASVCKSRLLVRVCKSRLSIHPAQHTRLMRVTNSPSQLFTRLPHFIVLPRHTSPASASTREVWSSRTILVEAPYSNGYSTSLDTAIKWKLLLRPVCPLLFDFFESCFFLPLVLGIRVTSWRRGSFVVIWSHGTWKKGARGYIDRVRNIPKVRLIWCSPPPVSGVSYTSHSQRRSDASEKRRREKGPPLERKHRLTYPLTCDRQSDSFPRLS